MRLKYYKNQPVIFTDKEYNHICKRFDYSNFIEHEESKKNKESFHYMVNYESCILCDEYYSVHNCSNCPLEIFGEVINNNYFRELGCANLIMFLLNKTSFPVFFVDFNEIGYDLKDEEEAKKELDIINKELKSFKHVTKEYVQKIKNSRKIKNEKTKGNYK